MGSSSCTVSFVVLFSIVSSAASAARVDFNDPRRAVGREDDVRIDAQLLQDTLSPGAGLNVTYQVQNLTPDAIAVSDRIYDVSFDAETSTITVSIGSEIPVDGVMPHMVLVPSGKTKTFTAGTYVSILIPRVGSPFVAVPRQVQIKINVLRDVRSFLELIERQGAGEREPKLSDALFDEWIDKNDSIFLNTLPVSWRNRGPERDNSAERRAR